MRNVYLAIALLLTSTSAHSIDVYRSSDSIIDLDKLVEPNIYTVVMIWSLDCYYCELQKPIAAEFNRKHKVLRANVLLVANDGPVYEQAITAKHKSSGIGLINYVATEGFYKDYRDLTGNDYLATPTYLLYGPDKQLQGVHVGPLDFDNLESIVANSQPTVTPSADLIR